MKLVFFLEEPSIWEMLKILLPKIVPEHDYKAVIFEGKQDMEKRLGGKLRAWLHTENVRFIVIRDQDSGDCVQIKQRLADICWQAGKPDVLIRIACHELESFYLGDLAAVGKAFALPNLYKQQNSRKFRNPDRLANAAEELKKLVNRQYGKMSGSRAIAPHLNLDGNNHSHSFNMLINSLANMSQ